MRKAVVSGVIGLVSLLSAGLASAQSVVLDPSSQITSVGGIATVDINAVDMPELFSFGLVLEWDAGLTLLTSDADIRTAIESNFELSFAQTVGNKLDLSGSFLFGGPISGNFTVASLEFQPTTEGTFNITVSPRANDPFLAPTGLDLDPQPTLVGATIETPTAVPLPGAIWLFGAGLLGMVGVARRRSASAA